MDFAFVPPTTEQQVLEKCREDITTVAKLTALAEYDAEAVRYFAEKVVDEKEAAQRVTSVYSDVRMSREDQEDFLVRRASGLALGYHVETSLSIIFGKASAEEVFPIFGYHLLVYNADLSACGVYKYAEEVIRCGNKVEAAVKSITGMEKSDQVTTAWTVAEDMKRETEAIIKAEWVEDYWRGNNVHPKTMMAKEKEALFKAVLAERDFYFTAGEVVKEKGCSSVEAEAWRLLMEVKQWAVTSTSMASMAAEDVKCAAMQAQKKQKKWQGQQ
jgi:hypothetical protein